MIEKDAKFIWVSDKIYPNMQLSSISYFSPEIMKYKFGVAGFQKNYTFEKKILSAEIEIFGDTRYYLWANNTFIGSGPVPTAGDFPMPCQYYDQYEIPVHSNSLSFYVRVQLTNVAELDSSCGKGGLILCALLTFEDGSTQTVYTDDGWLARKENEFISPRLMDYTCQKDEWKSAVITDCVWSIEPSQIKHLSEETVLDQTFSIEKGSTEKFYVELDKIYSGYICLDIKAQGNYKTSVISSEVDGISAKKHTIIGNRSEQYRSHEMDSIGECTVIVENSSNNRIDIGLKVLFSCYPSEEKGGFQCSDSRLNDIYNLGKWTVKICRQSIELDSPVHLENLFCTGDYMIESLVNNCTTGDYTLTRFDLLRMSRYFEATEGYKYLTTYSLMWLSMLYDYFMYTGDKSIFFDTQKGLESMLHRFSGFEDSNGIIDDVTNYMFVDWVYIDGYRMSCPPRALGETFLNALYYNALKITSAIYYEMGLLDRSEYYKEKSKAFHKVFNNMFFDKEKGLYFDGRNKPNEVNRCMPENSDKRYHTIYSNTLAVLYGLCDKEAGREIMERFIEDKDFQEPQPYFMHFVLEAITEVGLFEKYGMKLILKWEKLVNECNKGMKEVWKTFEGYETDFSHGWGSTPTYQLPTRLLGLEILKPGFEAIRLNPKLFGLEWAKINLPTPKGIISAYLCQDKEAEIHLPEGIELIN